VSGTFLAGDRTQNSSIENPVSSIEHPTLVQFSSLLTIRFWSCVLVAIKIGNIFRQFSIKNADTSEQKSKFLNNF